MRFAAITLRISIFGSRRLQNSSFYSDNFNVIKTLISLSYFFPKALRRVLPENLLKTDTSTLTPEH